MAVIALAAAAPALGLTFASGVAGGLAGIGIGIGAAYLDRLFIYPALFPADSPTPDSILNIDAMTADPGGPRNWAFGRAALVSGHVLTVQGIVQSTQQSTRKGKGSAGAIQDVRADVWVAWCDNFIHAVQVVYADGKPLWRLSPNKIAASDHRLAVSTDGGGARLVLTDSDTNGPDWWQLFADNDVVLMTGLVPATVNGYWRVYSRRYHGQGGLLSRVVLSPLDSQDPATATSAGTVWSPATAMRVEDAVVDHRMTVAAWPGAWILVTAPVLTPAIQAFSRFVAGEVVRLRNFTCTTGNLNGLWRVESVQLAAGVWSMILRPLEGQPAIGAGTATAGTATSAGQIVSQSPARFSIADDVQQHIIHLGRDDEPSDLRLQSYMPATQIPGYRGLARSTFQQFWLTPWGATRIPQMRAVVQANPIETTVSALSKILARKLAEEQFDLSELAADPVWGFNIRGPQPLGAVLQPLMIARGIEAQDRGGVLAFFKAADADAHALDAAELGARAIGSQQRSRPFEHTRIQDRELPARLSLQYVNPLKDHQDDIASAGQRNPGAAQVTSDHVRVQCSPLVLHEWEAQQRADQILVDTIVGRDQGVIRLPPSRMDILENDRVTFRALNHHDAVVDVSTGAIAHTVPLKPIVAGTVSLEVVFAAAGSARLVDDGAGLLTGFPSSVTVIANAVDYTAGTIDFEVDNDVIDSARIRYEFPHDWRMRAQKVTTARNRVLELQLIAVDEDLPVIGPSQEPSLPNSPVFYPPAKLTAEIIDVAAAARGMLDRPGIVFAACPKPGSQWRGASVFMSVDNGANYDLLTTMQEAVTMGVTTDALASGDVAVQDWLHSVNVQLDYGTLMSLGMDWLQRGANWALIGDEIVAFESAVLESDGTYTLSGLLRGLRDTADEVSGHAAGERFVMLTGLGYYGAFHEWARGAQDLGRARKFKVVATGALVGDIDAVDHTPAGWNARPFAPSGLIITTDDSGDLLFTWHRRTRDIVPTFDAGSMAPLLEPYERYHLTIIRDATTVRHVYLGGPQTGSPFVHRLWRYTTAAQSADGFSGGSTLILLVAQVGQAGEGKSATAAMTL